MMVNVSDILQSSKKEGIHEGRIIQQLIPFFESLNYQTIPHARFNISWGNILSDIDMLLIKDDQLGAVEVKSSKDNLRRAKKQIDNIRDYVDFVYIATNYMPRKFPYEEAGLIHVDESVKIIKEPEILKGHPRLISIDSIPKKCLFRLADIKGIKHSVNTKKLELSEQILNNSISDLKKELKNIVTCGLRCETQCPIWSFNPPSLISTSIKICS